MLDYLSPDATRALVLMALAVLLLGGILAARWLQRAAPHVEAQVKAQPSSRHAPARGIEPEQERPKRVVDPPATASQGKPLALLEFEDATGRVAVRGPRVVIGRHSEDDVRISDIRVSRHHALLAQNAQGAFEIHNQTADRSQPNDVLVNGVYREHAVLGDGDRVTLGGVNFIFRLVEPA